MNSLPIDTPALAALIGKTVAAAIAAQPAPVINITIPARTTTKETKVERDTSGLIVKTTQTETEQVEKPATAPEPTAPVRREYQKQSDVVHPGPNELKRSPDAVNSKIKALADRGIENILAAHKRHVADMESRGIKPLSLGEWAGRYYAILARRKAKQQAN